MAQYIDANEFQKKLEEVIKEPDYRHEGEDWRIGVCLAGTILDKFSTADVVPKAYVNKLRIELKGIICEAIKILHDTAYTNIDDVCEVVRCKDCIHYRNHPNGLCYAWTEPYDNERGYDGEVHCVEEDDFCSYAELKEKYTEGGE
jgi:hypothetical protein